MTNANDRDEREKSTDSIHESSSQREGFGSQDKKSTTAADESRTREAGAEAELGSSSHKPTRQMTGGPAKPTA